MDFIALLLKKTEVFLSDPNTLNTFINNRFLVILLVIILLKAKYSTYKSIWMTALINIPGTFLHEMSHYLAGLLLNARPTGFNLLPFKRDESYVLGSVGFSHIRFYNAVPAALAPLLLLFAGYYFNEWFFAHAHISYISYTLYVLLQTIIIENAIPSSADFKIAFSCPLSVLFYGVLFVFACVFL